MLVAAVPAPTAQHSAGSVLQQSWAPLWRACFDSKLSFVPSLFHFPFGASASEGSAENSPAAPPTENVLSLVVEGTPQQ